MTTYAATAVQNAATRIVHPVVVVEMRDFSSTITLPLSGSRCGSDTLLRKSGPRVEQTTRQTDRPYRSLERRRAKAIASQPPPDVLRGRLSRGFVGRPAHAARTRFSSQGIVAAARRRWRHLREATRLAPKTVRAGRQRDVDTRVRTKRIVLSERFPSEEE